MGLQKGYAEDIIDVNASMERLEDHIKDFPAKMKNLSSEDLLYRKSEGKWSKKEILGHLIDSAQANIRRFVESQYDNKPHIVYNQDKWVKACNYQEMENSLLINLWYLLNLQISAILENMPAGAGERLCVTEAEHTLQWLADDYIKHLKHHLHQILNLETVPYP